MVSGPLISAAEAVRVLGSSVVLDARAGPGARDQWLGGHAPGARFVDLERNLSDVGDPSRGGRHPLPDWSTWLARVGSWGIEPTTPLLIYDANDAGMAAARAWWMLREIGHASLSVVDGGWEALCDAGVSIETGDVTVAAKPDYRSTKTGWAVVDAARVEELRADPAWTLLDARAPDRYAGRTEPIDPVAGHIPGAVNLHWKSNVDEDGRLKPRDAIRAKFRQVLGDAPSERVICYCGSGVTACHLLLAMEASELSGAKLYVGSWSEWCRTRPDAISPS